MPADQAMEESHLVVSEFSAAEDGEIDKSCRARLHPRFFVALAWSSLAVVLVVAGAGVLRQARPQAARAAAWKGDDDITQDFELNFKDTFQRFEEKMKGLTGTCSSGLECNGNPGAVRRSCDSSGHCEQLPVAYCCTDPKSVLKTELHNGEVTCTCSTTSKTLQRVESRFDELKEGSSMVLNRLRAVTGQCLTGRLACMSHGNSETLDGVLHCCPQGQAMSKVKAGLTTLCRCK